MNAIVTINIGKYHSAISNITHPLMRAYAKKINADFIVIDSPSISATKPELEIFQIFGLLNKYKRIIYFHTDVLVRDDCPDLFNIVPENKLGAFNEGLFVDRLDDMRLIVKQLNVDVDKWDRQFYNTGVLVISRKHKFLFEYPNSEIHAFSTAAFLNLRIISAKTDIFDLDYNYHRLPFIDQLTGEHRLASYVLHYSGLNKGIKENGIKLDLESWQSNAPNYDYKQNILIKVHGGLGDEICAEPIVRYITEKAYPNSNIVVKTWFPRLFIHLPVTVVNINEPLPSIGTDYYLMETLVPPEHPSWKYMSANLMHATDFMSQICLRQILPDEDKQIRLAVTLEDTAEVIGVTGICDLSEFVLVHPGRGWDSKSFPKSYWDAIISGLVKDGHKVAIIGKHISDEQGTIDVEIPEGAVDFRNLLGLGGLIALISQAKLLISNDSAPVHIAGAFDNNIILIPTCKHPDHVLPVRNGNRMYKAKALYKKLICGPRESNPTLINGKTIDKVPGNIFDYLPDVADVIASAKDT